MRTNDIETEPELQRVLWACYKYWQGESSPTYERTICYSWVLPIYEGRFGTGFNQAKLRRLATLGFLEQGDTARGGGRRYYKIVNPDQVDGLLRKWNLP